MSRVVSVLTFGLPFCDPAGAHRCDGATCGCIDGTGASGGSMSAADTRPGGLKRPDELLDSFDAKGLHRAFGSIRAGQHDQGSTRVASSRG